MPFTILQETLIDASRIVGLALAPWDVLAAGKIRTDAQEEERRKTGEKGRVTFNPDWERNEDEKKISAALEKVAAEVGAKSVQAGKHPYYRVSMQVTHAEQVEISTTDAWTEQKQPSNGSGYRFNPD